MPPASPHQDQIVLGVIHGAMAFFLLAIMSVCAKLLSANHHVLEIVFYRNLIPLIPVLVYAVVTRKTYLLKTTKKVAMLFRALIGTTGIIFTFNAFKYLPLSDATVIFFTATLLAPALSFFILKEHVGPWRWAAILGGFCGVVLIAAPSGEAKLFGIGIAFAAAFIHAIVHLLLRHLKTESPFTVTFYFFLAGSVIPGLFMPFVAHMPGREELLLFAGLGVFGGVAQFYLTSAFNKAPVALVAPLNYTGLIWATGFDMLFWNYVPGWTVFAGSAIIIGCNLIIIWREQRLKRLNPVVREARDKSAAPT